MTRMDIPTVDPYARALEQALPAFSPDEQRAAVTLYRELARRADAA